MRRKYYLLGISLVAIALVAGFGLATTKPEIRIKAALDQTVYPKNAPIGVAILVYSTKNTQVEFSSAKLYDLILEKDGKTIWQLSDMKMYAQGLMKRDFKAGQPQIYSTVIDTSQIKLESGHYLLKPVLCGNPAITGEPVTFDIQ